LYIFFSLDRRRQETCVEIEKINPGPSTKIFLCRIVANLTAFSNNSCDRLSAGIMKRCSNDIRLQVTSSLALEN
jgi:hypothetical protein